MKFLLDTDHVSILQLRSGPEYPALTARVALHGAKEVAFSIISFHEQTLGCHTFISRARGPNDLIRGYNLLDMVLRGFSAAPVLPFDTAAVAFFDKLRGQRIRVATMDLRIASIALSRGLVLLTRNVSDFGKVPGLVTQDWTL